MSTNVSLPFVAGRHIIFASAMRGIQYILVFGTVPQDFRLHFFFMNKYSPSPWVSYKGHFKFFWKFVEIFTAQAASPVPLTPVANGKIFNQRSFKYFVWTPLGSRVNLKIIFFFKYAFRCKQSDCSHYFPPVLLIPKAICHWCCWHLWQIYCLCHVPNLPQFQGNQRTSGNLPSVSLILVANLPTAPV